MGAETRRILVVEDNLINQKVAVALLTQMGYGCDVATDGRQALDFLDQREYGAVLMDCQMPVMDGYETTREIRRREGDAHTAIVAMTASAMASDRARCLAVGMDDYLAKPIDRQLLASVLEHCVGDEAAASSPPPQLPGRERDPVDADVLAQLHELDGGQGFFEQLVAVFRREVAPRMPELRQAVEDCDLAHAGALAHSFKGACATLGLQTLAPLFERIERRARDEAITGLAADVAAVETELGRTLDRLDRLAASPSA
jgi:CheY-like chemotaxis protein